ncbi:hypothetical protein [Prochlorothrix hollandica]|uniref:Uncharacterized protein n=1 Tax=Prochlorothrix hollandica PCC 9006 = CALU 1027 TaxID=317619 RepID=A0A0M2PXJ0_PROHO|nr:hypothetical protein [Prochlorothrix hollandica]KKJ01156.1 hypothetical protein PROH_01830 [Prochlorothrix hollandica PCC 9006 = CALU 1027]
MFGIYQKSCLRLEVPVTEIQIQESLCRTEALQQWLFPQQFSSHLPDRLEPQLTFSSWLGPITIDHTVTVVEPYHLQLLLSRGVDGFHEWTWGEGWVQSRLEGISLLPLNLAQTYGLVRLRQFLAASEA